MSELKILNGDGTEKFLGSFGTGATGDPYHNIPADFYTEVSKGNVVGHDKISKFGANPTINIADGFATVWDGGGTYVAPTQARIHDVVSDAAADAGTVVSSGTATGGSLTTIIDTGATFVSDGVAVSDIVLNDNNTAAGRITAVTSETTLTFAGSIREPEFGQIDDPFESGDAYRVVTDASTGAAFIYITGLDLNLSSIKEFIVLNGTSNVATVKSYRRQFRARAFAMASTGTVGTVTSTAQTDGTVTCQIINGNNQSLMSIYTVPVGKTAHILSWWGTLSKKQAAASIVNLRIGSLTGMSYIQQVRGLNSVGSSDFYYDYKIPLAIVGGSDIWVEANTDTNALSVGSGFDLLLVDD